MGLAKIQSVRKTKKKPKQLFCSSHRLAVVFATFESSRIESSRIKTEREREGKEIIFMFEEEEEIIE